MGIDSILQQNMQNAGLAGIDRLAGNAMYPQSQMDKTQYSVSSQMPTSAEVMKSDYEPITNPYSGGMTQNFAEGGEVPTSWDPESGQVKLQEFDTQNMSVSKTSDYTIPKDDIQTFVPDMDNETGLPNGSGQYILNNGSRMMVDGTGTVIGATPARDEYTLNKDGYYQPTGAGLTWDGNSSTLTKKIGGIDVQVPGLYHKGGYQDEQGGLRVDEYGTPIALAPNYLDSGFGKSGLSDAAPYVAMAALAAATYGAASPMMAGTAGAGAAGAGAAGAGATAASTMPAWLTAAGKGAAIGSAMGGGSAALTGGNIGQGIIRGGITGAIGGGAGNALGGGLMGNMAGGALAGGAGSALRGGNVLEGAGMGAVGGALNTGISGLDAPDAVKTGLNMFGKPLVMSQIRGAMGGGQGPQGIGGIPGATQNAGINANTPGMFNFAPNTPPAMGLGISSPQVAPVAAQQPLFLSKLSEFKYDAPYEMAAGGMAHGGGISDLGTYSDGGRLLKGPGDGMSDHIPATIGAKQPARLAEGEFVVPADVVSHLGNGSTDAGAKQLYKMMDNIRKARTGNPKQGKQINPDKFTPKG